MIEIPIHNTSGEQVGTLQVDEQLLGGEVRPALLKQAYVRYHANRRQGTAKSKTRSEVEGSTRKLYKQKGTGNARRGSIRANILRGGGHAKAKRPHSWRQDMPEKMRRLANCNALLAKMVDGEIKLVDGLNFDKPSTREFNSLLSALKIDRSCLVALNDTTGHIGRSAKNIDTVSLTHVDRLNAFDLLNHRYLLAEKEAFEAYISRATDRLGAAKQPAREVALNMQAIDVIKRPLITEKSTWEGERHNRYAFEVALDARKQQIRDAIQKLYGVRVEKVHTQVRKGQYFRTKFGTGKTSSWKKATVELHADDRIDLF